MLTVQYAAVCFPHLLSLAETELAFFIPEHVLDLWLKQCCQHTHILVIAEQCLHSVKAFSSLATLFIL